MPTTSQISTQNRFFSSFSEDRIRSCSFGFNGQLKDNELYGEGNAYAFEYRIQDTRIGRFLSVDPLFKDYPYYSTYQFAGNTPIWATDLEGLEPNFTNTGFSSNAMGTLAYQFETYFKAASNLIPNINLSVKPYVAVALGSHKSIKTGSNGMVIPKSSSFQITNSYEFSFNLSLNVNVTDFMKSEGVSSPFSIDGSLFNGLVQEISGSFYEEGLPIPVFGKMETRENFLTGQVEKKIEVGFGTDNVNVNAGVKQNSSGVTTTTSIYTGATIKPEAKAGPFSAGVEVSGSLEKQVYEEKDK